MDIFNHVYFLPYSDRKTQVVLGKARPSNTVLYLTSLQHSESVHLSHTRSVSIHSGRQPDREHNGPQKGKFIDSDPGLWANVFPQTYETVQCKWVVLEHTKKV